MAHNEGSIKYFIRGRKQNDEGYLFTIKSIVPFA